MGVFYLFFGFFVIFFVCCVGVIIAVVVTKVNRQNKENKGDYLAPKPKKTQSYDPFSAYNANAPTVRTAQNPAANPAARPAAAGETSPVHANCDHAKKPSPYIDINDTYSMVWDEFKSFALKLLTAEYPSAKISPYRYRGAPDIQLQTGGKNVDVRLIFVRADGTVDKKDFEAALKDVDENDDTADWIITNGRFSVMQRSAASSKRVTLYDADDMFAMMRRCNVSAKKSF